MLLPEFLPVWEGVGTYIVELIRHLPRSVEVFVVAPSRIRVARENARTADYDFADILPDNIHVDLISSASDNSHPRMVLGDKLFRLIGSRILRAFQGESSACQLGLFAKYYPVT